LHINSSIELSAREALRLSDSSDNTFLTSLSRLRGGGNDGLFIMVIKQHHVKKVQALLHSGLGF